MTPIYVVLIWLAITAVVGWIAYRCGYAAKMADKAEKKAQAEILASRQSNANRWGTQ